MPQSLSTETANSITDVQDISQMTYTGLAALFLNETGAASNAPLSAAALDPRSSEPVVYSIARRRRPVDNKGKNPAHQSQSGGDCVICSGKSTRIVDLAPLSEGFTFINKNLYPAVWPAPVPGFRDEPVESSLGTGHQASGLHFLQWTSNSHDVKLHTMPHEDAVTVMSRLAVLEKQLLTTASGCMPSTVAFGDPRGYAGYVSIIKNGGAEVGGSLEHCHQQVIFSNLMPRRMLENWRFQQENGITFASHMLIKTPSALVLRDYDTAVLLVPSFMRRPGDMFLIVKDTRKRYLHQLSPQELEDVSQGWQDAIAAIHSFMPTLGRPAAFNVITLNGPGAGLHFAFLPFTQETGGFEQLGLSVCQADPFEMAELIRSGLI